MAVETNKSKKVIVAGHICLDITPVFPDKKVYAVSDMLRPGKLIQMKDADVHTGGCIANAGLGMKLLGADVQLMGKVGNDAFGDMVLKILEKYNCAAEMIKAYNESTSYSVVLAIPGIDRIFLHNPGANDTFCAKDIPVEKLKDTALLHFGYPPLMHRMYENDGAELLALLKTVKQAGCATSLDLAAVDPESEAGKADWELILRRVLPYVDFFEPSIEELCFMLDRPRLKEWQERASGKEITDVLYVEQDVKPLARKCMEYGAKVLLVKCGAPGIYYCTGDEAVLTCIGERVGFDAGAWADKEGFEVSYVPEQVLSGTGAGDTSIAAFLTSMLEGESLEECMRLAVATGASCVSAYDALSGLKPLNELKKKIADGWKKVDRKEG